MDLRITVFEHSRESFLDSLREHGVEFVEEPIGPGTIRASGGFLVLLEVVITSAAAVLVAWLKTRPIGKKAKRKVILRSGTESIDIEGYSADEVKQILERGTSKNAAIDAIVVIQTAKDDD